MLLLLNEAFLVKSKIAMSYPHCADSVGNHIFGLSVVSVVFEKANDAVGFERSIFSDNQDYKNFLCVVVNSYVPTFFGLDVHGGRKLITYTQTYTHKTITLTLAVHAHHTTCQSRQFV